MNNNTAARRILFWSAVVASMISAAFMSATLHHLAPAGWVAYLAGVIGILLEVFKACLSSYAPLLKKQRRYIELTISFAFIGSVLVFAVWAGQERLIQGVAAEQKLALANAQVRIPQIEHEISLLKAREESLARDVVADTALEKSQLGRLYAQVEVLREGTYLTRAAELERGEIAALRKTIADKEEAARAENAARFNTAVQVAAERKALEKELFEINSRVSKIEVTSTEASVAILKVIVLVVELSPAFIFWLVSRHGFIAAPAPAAPAAPAALSTSPVMTRSAPGHRIEPTSSAPRAVAAAPEHVRDERLIAVSQVAPQAERDGCADPAIAAKARAHSRYAEALETVRGMSRGEPVTTSWLKSTFSLGGDTAQAYICALSVDGLVERSAKSWVRS